MYVKAIRWGAERQATGWLVRFIIATGADELWRVLTRPLSTLVRWCCLLGWFCVFCGECSRYWPLQWCEVSLRAGLSVVLVYVRLFLLFGTLIDGAVMLLGCHRGGMCCFPVLFVDDARAGLYHSRPVVTGARGLDCFARSPPGLAPAFSRGHVTDGFCSGQVRLVCVLGGEREVLHSARWSGDDEDALDGEPLPVYVCLCGWTSADGGGVMTGGAVVVRRVLER